MKDLKKDEFRVMNRYQLWQLSELIWDAIELQGLDPRVRRIAWALEREVDEWMFSLDDWRFSQGGVP